MACRGKRRSSLTSPIVEFKDNSGKIASTPQIYFNKCLREEIREFILVKHESSPLYFEEPILRWTPDIDETKYVASGLCTSPNVRSKILDRVNENVNRQKKQGWLFEELMMLKRKLDDANYEISKTKTDIYILLQEKKEFMEDIKFSRQYSELLQDQLETFKKKCKAMSAEIDDWRRHVGKEKERLDNEYENRKRQLENEYDKKYEELRKASDDFAKKNSDLEKEWKRIIEWKENTEQQHKEKEEEIRKLKQIIETMKQLEFESKLCIHHCGSSSIRTPAEAEELIAKEIDNSCYFPFVFEFPSSGFHLLHDVWLLLSVEYQWKPVSGSHIKNFCNLMCVARDGIAAKVILYVPWCVETQIKCYIMCSQNHQDACKMLLHDLCYGLQLVFQKRSCKLQLKTPCQNPSCRPDDRHLATASVFHPGYFVCDRRKEEYPNTCLTTEALEAVMNCRSVAGSSSYISLEESKPGSTSCDEAYLESKMEFCDIMKDLSPGIFTEWQMIAAHLNLQTHIGVIKYDNSSNIKNCLIALLELWERNEEKPFIWRTWIEILRHPTISQKKLADKITDDLKKKKILQLKSE